MRLQSVRSLFFTSRLHIRKCIILTLTGLPLFSRKSVNLTGTIVRGACPHFQPKRQMFPRDRVVNRDITKPHIASTDHDKHPSLSPNRSKLHLQHMAQASDEMVGVFLVERHRRANLQDVV